MSELMKNKKIVGVIAVAVVVVVMVLFGGGRSYEDVVNDYYDGMLKGDAKKVVATFSDRNIEERLRISGCKDRDALVRMLQDNLDFLQERLGDRWNPSYQIVDVKEYDKKAEVTVWTVDLNGVVGGDSLRCIILREIDGEWYIDGEYKIR